MIDYVTTNSDLEFIVATEAGVLYKMRELNPNTRLIPAPIYDNNSCSCSECSFMKVNTLEKLRNCLRDELPEIIIDSNILEKAAEPIFKMLKIKSALISVFDKNGIEAIAKKSLQVNN